MKDTQTKTEAEDIRITQGLELFSFSSPLPTKTSGILRIFYNNCNGIEIGNTIGAFLKQKKEKKKYDYIQDTQTPTKLDGILRQMKMWDVDVTTLAEFGVAWEDNVPRRVVKQITQRYEYNASWTVSSSVINLGSYLKPGGTGTLVMGQTTGRIIDRGTDPWKMGRWSYTLLKGPTTEKSLLIIAGYKAGKRTSPGGFRTAWSQQNTMLLQADRQESPHEAFLVDLQQWLQQYRKESMEILLCLDANEQWGKSAAITKFATAFELRNINREMNLPRSFTGREHQKTFW